ncbi:Fructan 1-exohydrolase [Hordeum vulgare]|nr:Fructan 1-exohydrolase [Hordeum vulgare]
MRRGGEAGGAGVQGGEVERGRAQSKSGGPSQLHRVGTTRIPALLPACRRTGEAPLLSLAACHGQRLCEGINGRGTLALRGPRQAQRGGVGVDSVDKYMIGVYDLQRDAFVPNNVVDDRRLWLRIDYNTLYASKSFFDSKKGRRIVWGWSRETDSPSDDLAKGWAGLHFLLHLDDPRDNLVTADGKQLLQWPVEEIEYLRTNEINHQGLELNKGDLFEIKEVDAFQANVEIDFELASIDEADPFDPSWLLDPEKHCGEAGASVPGGIGPFGLVIVASDNMDEHTEVYWRVYKSQEKYMVLMCSDLRRSSLRPGLEKPAYGGFFEFDLAKERKISLRTLIDRSAVESFGGGGRVCITSRVYPAVLTDVGRAHIYAFNNGSATVRVPQLRAWTMRKAQGFPGSVTPDYVPFQMWDTLQGLSTYIRAMLSTQGTLDAARRASAFVRGDDVVHKLFTEIAYLYK